MSDKKIGHALYRRADGSMYAKVDEMFPGLKECEKIIGVMESIINDAREILETEEQGPRSANDR